MREGGSDPRGESRRRLRCALQVHRGADAKRQEGGVGRLPGRVRQRDGIFGEGSGDEEEPELLSAAADDAGRVQVQIPEPVQAPEQLHPPLHLPDVLPRANERGGEGRGGHPAREDAREWAGGRIAVDGESIGLDRVQRRVPVHQPSVQHGAVHRGGDGAPGQVQGGAAGGQGRSEDVSVGSALWTGL